MRGNPVVAAHLIVTSALAPIRFARLASDALSNETILPAAFYEITNFSITLLLILEGILKKIVKFCQLKGLMTS